MNITHVTSLTLLVGIDEGDEDFMGIATPSLRVRELLKFWVAAQLDVLHRPLVPVDKN